MVFSKDCFRVVLTLGFKILKDHQDVNLHHKNYDDSMNINSALNNTSSQSLSIIYSGPSHINFQHFNAFIQIIP
jgi:hypothetical protein